MKVMDRYSPAREKILAVASDLFYKNGYRATGINEIIEKSNVAKATFYAHFPSKEELGKAYVRRTHFLELEYVKDHLKNAKTPLDRYLSIMKSQEPWLQSVQIKGCPFLNLVPEITDAQSPIRLEGKEFYETLRGLIREVTKELFQSNRKKYGRRDIERATNDYLVTLLGGLSLSALYHDIWPIRHAIAMIRKGVE